MISETLLQNEYNVYYKPYIDIATTTNIVEGLTNNFAEISSFLTRLPKEKHSYAYADGKWIVKDILLHLIDTERIFAYRALRIARNDLTPLAGFDQDDYVINGKAAKRSFKSLMNEYNAVRLATVSLFKSFETQDLLKIGEASGSPISVRAIGYIIQGHENHHINIIKERYLD